MRGKWGEGNRHNRGQIEKREKREMYRLKEKEQVSKVNFGDKIPPGVNIGPARDANEEDGGCRCFISRVERFFLSPYAEIKHFTEMTRHRISTCLLKKETVEHTSVI